MSATSLRYSFSQHFDVPPAEAFAWSVDYRPDDHKLMGRKGTRKIAWISDDAVVLTDTVETGTGRVTKERLVRIYPDRLSWTNTHLSGPNQHSQFLYEIVPDRGGSRLNFTGLQLNYQKMSKRDAERLAKQYAKEDAELWVRLAGAMERDIPHARGRGTRKTARRAP